MQRVSCAASHATTALRRGIITSVSRRETLRLRWAGGGWRPHVREARASLALARSPLCTLCQTDCGTQISGYRLQNFRTQEHAGGIIYSSAKYCLHAEHVLDPAVGVADCKQGHTPLQSGFALLPSEGGAYGPAPGIQTGLAKSFEQSSAAKVTGQSRCQES